MAIDMGVIDRVTSVRFTKPWWTRAFIFQSWGQTISYVISVGLVLLAVFIVVHVAGEQLTLGPIIGAAFGALAAVQITQQAVFSVKGSHLAGELRTVEDYLARIGFIREPDSKAAITHYRSKLPRWLTFRENDVYLHRGEGVIAIYGPRYIVKSLHKAVVRYLKS